MVEWTYIVSIIVLNIVFWSFFVFYNPYVVLNFRFLRLEPELRLIPVPMFVKLKSFPYS